MVNYLWVREKDQLLKHSDVKSKKMSEMSTCTSSSIVGLHDLSRTDTNIFGKFIGMMDCYHGRHLSTEADCVRKYIGKIYPIA